MKETPEGQEDIELLMYVKADSFGQVFSRGESQFNITFHWPEADWAFVNWRFSLSRLLIASRGTPKRRSKIMQASVGRA